MTSEQAATEPAPVLDVAVLTDALNEWWFDPNDPPETRVGGIDADKAAAFIAEAYRDYFDKARAVLDRLRGGSDGR